MKRSTDFFCTGREVVCAAPPPVGRAREIRRLIQGSSPKTCFETISGGERVCWRGKWGGLVLGYLLGKNFRRNDDACGGERAADPLHCRGIDSELFGNDTHTGAPGAARAYPNSLRHLRSSLARRYHPADSNCERIRSEHFLDFMKQRHSPLLRSGPPV